MNVKSIENKDLVNLENCDAEPIHIPGSIQPHGFLLGLNTTYDIAYCSANIPAYGITVEQALNKKLADVFDNKEAASLDQYLNERIFESSKPHVLNHAGTEFNVTAHVSGAYFILEFEPFPDGSLELSNLYLQTKKFTEILSQSNGLQQLCQSVCEEIRAITGYDRVMVYKFDEQYNGEVFAEAKNDDIEPFLGLHYPHTDIPAQARELYLRNLMRMIVDIGYTPVPIVTLHRDASNSHLDMSHSVLRSVSPIHVAYLKNMGVGGTLTISLIWENRLWGMITCHHYSPKNIPHYIRLATLMQGHFLTSQIRVQEVNADYKLKIALDEKLKTFLYKLQEHSLNEERKIVSQKVIGLTNATGVCIVNDGMIQTHGDVPDDKEVLQLIKHLAKEKNDFASSNNISRDLSISFESGIPGFLYYKTDENTCVIWFRNELKKEVVWAGDPTKAILKDEKGLNPRKSFAQWNEIVSGYSNDWLPTEISIANQSVYAIQKHFSFIKDKDIQKKQNSLLTKLKQANEELENINWISTHDLKEPLRKIRLFASILLDSDKHAFSEDAGVIITKMSVSAAKMQRLLDDLSALARVRDGAYAYELTDLNKLVQAVISENEETAQEHGTTFITEELPELYCLPVLLSQLFANLISNAIKFSKTDVPLIINISCKEITGADGIKYYELSLADNGVGFENKYNELIFQVFQRLEKNKDIEGTGIGLAICKKIVAIHKGKLTAAGEKDMGATFKMILPYNPAKVVM